MPTYYHNPENALKRANEFCELGKEEEAVECLFDALKNRKSRMMKLIHENIINKFLELCVELKKSQMAKDGLYSYRNLCQGVNVKSWEDSILRYLQLAESKVESAQVAFQSFILDVEDLDQDVTPEILLKCVSSEGAQDRTERSMLLPWIKFLWECHRNCLDILRNTQTGKLYHSVAQSAFKFCVKFSRRSELRKLCSILRMHAMHMQKRQANLRTDDVETNLIFLETGFVELESAINMELWQDAFKAIEDIHAVISVSKKFQQSRIMAHYYDKISSIFWKGEEYVFHAAANLRYFLLVRDQKKNLSSEDIIKLACRVMLSILAVPPAPVNPATNLVAETDVSFIDKKNRLLSSLLDLSKCPTRASLIKDAIRLGIIQYLPEQLKDLFQALEEDISTVHRDITVATDFIQNWIDCELEQYVPLIHKIVVIKLLPVLSNMYVNIKMSKLLNLTGITLMSGLEIILVDSARRYEFPLRIDHKNMCVHFPSDFNIFQREEIWKESVIKDSLPDIHLRSLVYTHSALKRAVAQICPEMIKNENKLIAEKIVRSYQREKETYRKRLLQRKITIEKHKEHIENVRLQKEEEQRKLMADKLLHYEMIEKERLLRETEERKMQRQQREQEEIQRKILLEKMETFKKTCLGSQIVENLGMEEFDNLDPQILFSKQVEQLNKERKELTLKLRRQERNFDHIERAKRLEEIPLLIQQCGERKKADIELWREHERNKLETAYKKRTRDLHVKSRALDIKMDLENFIELVKKNKSESYTKEILQFMKTFQGEKQKRLQKRANDRKQKRKEEWIKQKNLERKRQVEISNQNIIIAKGENKYNRDTKNQSIKTIASPQKPASSNIIDETIFDEEVKSRAKANLVSSDIKRKYHSTETSEDFYLPKDIYYYKRIYKSRTVETEQTETYERRSHSKCFNESSAKPKSQNYRSDYYNASNQRIRTSSFEKSEETTFSWKTPTSRKGFSSYRFGRFSKEDETPQRTITIMRRDTKSVISSVLKETTDSVVQSERLLKPDTRRNETEYSCTPWAKLRRQAHDK